MCLLFQDLAQMSESDMTKQHCREPKMYKKQLIHYRCTLGQAQSIFNHFNNAADLLHQGEKLKRDPSNNNKFMWLSGIWTPPRACMAKQSLGKTRKPCPAGHLEAWDTPKTNG